MRGVPLTERIASRASVPAVLKQQDPPAEDSVGSREARKRPFLELP